MSTIDPRTASDDAIRAAVEGAEITPLLVAIASMTGDRRVLDEGTRPNALMMLAPDLGFTEADFARSRAAATEALIRHRDAGWPAPADLDDATVDEYITWMTGGWDPTEQLAMFREELDLADEDPRAPSWRVADIAPERTVRALVVGAGMSGIVATHRLSQAGVEVTVVDKNADVGGTWFENTYPGCRVDVPTFFYSYSFAQRRDWPETHAPQAVLLDYFRDCAERFGVRDRTRFSTEVHSATWDEAAAHWTVELATPDGPSTEHYDVVVSAVGQLNRPKFPDIAGIDTFAGTSFHTSRWRHDVDLTGQRVAVIGTGASAMQAIPEIAPIVGHLDVFQRTPNWLAPVPALAEHLSEGARSLLEHVPSYTNWWRLYQFWRLAEGMVPAAVVDPDWSGHPETVSALNEFVRDLFQEHIDTTFAGHPELLPLVTPHYPPIAKRIVRDDGSWARTLTRDDVWLHTQGIAEIVPEGIVDRDGTLHAVDVIIYGTGFHASEFLTPMTVTGLGGIDLHERWKGDARAYLGVTVPGFPNLFCLYGPNTNIVVNGSIIFFSEAETDYVVAAVEQLVRRGDAALVCREDAHDEFNRWIDEGNASMAWGVSDVNSWYKNDLGRVAQNWPYSLFEYWTRTRTIDTDAFSWIPRPR